MDLKKTIKQLLQHDENMKQKKFFTVSAQQPFSPKDATQRKKGWDSLCKAVSLPVEDSWIEGRGSQMNVVLLFSNGLRIEDAGQRVSFGVERQKSEVDTNDPSVKTVIGCAANHLCRLGFGTERVGSQRKPIISEIREGSALMVNVFESAYKQAEQLVNAEKIEQLKKTKNR